MRKKQSHRVMTRAQSIYVKYSKNSVLQAAVNKEYLQTLDFTVNFF